MIPIGTELPNDTASFRAALSRGLAPLGLDAAALTLEGEFPQFSALTLKLDHAKFHRGLPVSQTAAASNQPLCFVRTARISGHPVQVEKIPASVDLQAEDLVIASGDALNGAGKALTLGSVNRGTLDLSAQRSDLEAAMFALGQAAAKEKGADLQNVSLRLTSESPRQLAIRATVTAKAMFFTTTVTVTGSLVIDDALNARLTNLDCEGDGMIGKMAAGALRGQFEKVQSRVIPLGSALGGLALRDISISGGDALRIHAQFGSAM